MATMDIIEYFDESGMEMAHRVPESGSAETKFGSALVVRENQAAIFFRDGKAYDVMPAGRHHLTTQNIPLLTGYLSKLAGFGEKSPFRVEVVFINEKIFTNMKWGTREPVAFRDADFGIVRLRAFGNYTCRVKDPMIFVNTMVGTQGRYTTQDAENYLKDVIVSRLNDLLGEQLKSILDLPKIYDELGVAIKMRLKDDFLKYGLEMIDFFVQSVTPPEEVQKAIDERSSMAAVGDMNKYMQFQAAKSMREAASAEGGGGGLAGMGMGAGAGAGMGMMMAGMMGNAMNAAGGGGGGGGGAAPGGAAAAGGAAGAGAAMGAMTACPACQAQIPAGSKFCPSCGQKMESGKACPGCGQPNAPGAKFCANCGANLAAGAKCGKCGAELAAGAKFCPECGEKQG